MNTSAWVVGGTSGIGRAVAEMLVEQGRLVYSTGREVDVTSEVAISSFCRKRERIEQVVYSAGVNYLEWSHAVDCNDVKHLYDVNVLGLIRVLQHCTPQRVVVVGSDAAWRPMRTSVAYCASKAALHQAVKVIAREWAGTSRRINVVAPGKVSGTDMTRYVDKRSAKLRPDMDHDAYQRSQIPAGDFATVNEVAEVITKVLSIDTDYLNGEIIAVNGGR